MGVHSYRDLGGWQKSMRLASEIYRHTQRFPANETHGLTVQLGRTVVTIPSNVAERTGATFRKRIYADAWSGDKDQFLNYGPNFDGMRPGLPQPATDTGTRHPSSRSLTDSRWLAELPQIVKN